MAFNVCMYAQSMIGLAMTNTSPLVVRRARERLRSEQTRLLWQALPLSFLWVDVATLVAVVAFAVIACVDTADYILFDV